MEAVPDKYVHIGLHAFDSYGRNISSNILAKKKGPEREAIAIISVLS